MIHFERFDSGLLIIVVLQSHLKIFSVGIMWFLTLDLLFPLNFFNFFSCKKLYYYVHNHGNAYNFYVMPMETISTATL